MTEELPRESTDPTAISALVRATQAGGHQDALVALIRAAMERHDDALVQTVLGALRPADRADVIEDFELDEQRELLERLDDETAAEVLEWMSEEDAAEVAGVLVPEELAPILDLMDVDDAADVLGELTPKRQEETLARMDDTAEAEVRELLAFDPESAGGRMTTDFVSLHTYQTVAEALAQLRTEHPDPDTTYYLNVVDDAGRLAGVVSLRQLVISPPATPIGELMIRDVVYVHATDDQEAAARSMSRYDLLALPVVDEEGRLLGVITHDDLVEVLEREDAEDMFLLAGLGREQGPDDPVRSSVRHRLPWLVTNLATQLVLLSVLKVFEPVMASVTVLAVLYPLVTGNGGNVGAQTITIIVRGMALGEVERNNRLRILRKEVAVGLLNGLVMGVLAATVALVFARDTVLATSIAVAMFGAMVLNLAVGGFAGVLVPTSLQRLGQDPAVASSALVTSVTDTVGAFLFLGLFLLLAA